MAKHTPVDFTLEELNRLIKEKDHKLRRDTMFKHFKNDQAQRLSLSGILHVPKGKACISTTQRSHGFTNCFNVRVEREGNYGRTTTHGNAEWPLLKGFQLVNNKHWDLVLDYLVHWIVTGEFNRKAFLNEFNIIIMTARAKELDLSLFDYVDKKLAGLVDWNYNAIYALRNTDTHYLFTFNGKEYKFTIKEVENDAMVVIRNRHYRHEADAIELVKRSILGDSTVRSQDDEYLAGLKREREATYAHRDMLRKMREEREEELRRIREFNEEYS